MRDDIPLKAHSDFIKNKNARSLFSNIHMAKRENNALTFKIRMTSWSR